MNCSDPDKELEQLIHRRLRALPEVQAPEELIPEVLQQLTTPAPQPWPRRPWAEWPLAAKLVSAVLCAALGVLAWRFTGILLDGAQETMAATTQVLQVFKPLWTLCSAILDVVRLVVVQVKPQFLLLLVSMLAMIYLCTLGLGTLFYRMAVRRAYSFSSVYK
jgi:hypothetical protein